MARQSAFPRDLCGNVVAGVAKGRKREREREGESYRGLSSRMNFGKEDRIELGRLCDYNKQFGRSAKKTENAKKENRNCCFDHIKCQTIAFLRILIFLFHLRQIHK